MYFSESFKQIIKKIKENNINNEIQFLFEELIEGKNYGIDFDFDYVSCEIDSNDMVSFLNKKIVYKFSSNKNINEFIGYNKDNNLFWQNKSRTKIKIGRLITKFSEILNLKFYQHEIENFINLFKGFSDLFNNSCNFELVYGEDIKKYYIYTNYQNMKGHLGESCMRYKKCQEYFSIYVDNPNICSLLVLKGDNKKIIGRALLWNTQEGHIYLDRVYSSNDSDNILFEAYARKNLGCNYSYSQIYSFSFKKYVELSIKPTNIIHDKYPYMDTFKFYYINDNVILSNPHRKGEFVELTLTNGCVKSFNNEKVRLGDLF
jgi:hypothetical protein